MHISYQSCSQTIAKFAQQALPLLIAFGLDRLGEPPASWHPVVWYGKLIKCLERIAPETPDTSDTPDAQLLYGTMMLLVATPAALIPALVIQRLTHQLRHYFSQRQLPKSGMLIAALIEGISLKPFFALHMLIDAGQSVRLALENDDLPAAREKLASLVSRERSQLSEELAIAAAVESLAENLSDSVVAPLFYYALFGLPGAALYRLYNTFDSMIGYHGRYEHLGKAAARLDDLLNLVPSRLTALLIIALAPMYGGKWRAAWQIWRRDARKTESPNAGHPMSATAGALGIQLEKSGQYRLGDATQKLTPHHIRRAECMVQLIGYCTFGIVGLWTIGKLFWQSEREVV